MNQVNRYINQFYNLHSLSLARKPYCGDHGISPRDLFGKKHLKFNGSLFGIIEYLQYRLNYMNNKCKKCGGECKPGKALRNTLAGSSDFGGDFGQRGTTMSYSGKAKLVDVSKCSSCGHSFIPENFDSLKQK